MEHSTWHKLLKEELPPRDAGKRVERYAGSTA